MGRRDTSTRDLSTLRSAIGDLVESERFDTWVAELPDPALIQLMAPLEMLSFQYYLDPPSDRHLLRAAQVICESMAGVLDQCPADLAASVRRIAAELNRVDQ